MTTKKELAEKYNNAQYNIASLTAENSALANALVEKIKRIEELEAQVATYEETVKQQAEEINTLYVEKCDIEKEKDIYKKSYDEEYKTNINLRKRNRELSGDKDVRRDRNNPFDEVCKNYAHNKTTNETKRCDKKEKDIDKMSIEELIVALLNDKEIRKGINDIGVIFGIL